MLRELVVHAKQVALTKGYQMLVYNMDAQDPMRTAFPPMTFTTTFMHKLLRKAGSGPLAPTNFFDPRDI